MSDLNKLVDKIDRMKLSDLMVLCAKSIDSKDIDKKITDMLLFYLESRLIRRSTSKRLGIENRDL